MSNKQPVRLGKVEQTNPLKILNQDIMIKIKFYIILAIAMVLFLAVCFLLQHQTYGFINW